MEEDPAYDSAGGGSMDHYYTEIPSQVLGDPPNNMQVQEKNSTFSFMPVSRGVCADYYDVSGVGVAFDLPHPDFVQPTHHTFRGLMRFFWSG